MITQISVFFQKYQAERSNELKHAFFYVILHDWFVTHESRTWREKLLSIILPLDGGGLRWGWKWYVPPRPALSLLGRGR